MNFPTKDTVDQSVLNAQRESQILLTSLKEAVAIMEKGEVLPGIFFVVVKDVKELEPDKLSVTTSTGLFVAETKYTQFVLMYLYDMCMELARRLRVSAQEQEAPLVQLAPVKGTH